MRKFLIFTLFAVTPFFCQAKEISKERKETLLSIAKSDNVRLWSLDKNGSCALSKMPEEEVDFYLKSVLDKYKDSYKPLVKNKDEESLWYMHQDVDNIVKRVSSMKIQCNQKLIKDLNDFCKLLMNKMGEF